MTKKIEMKIQGAQDGGFQNTDEREVLRRWEVATVSGGNGPIAGTSRGVLGGRNSSALRFSGTLVPCVLC
jgi:hypothetical protein